MATASPAPTKIIRVAPFALQDAESEVVNLIRKSGPVSRSDLAGVTGYSRAKITSVINYLTDMPAFVPHMSG
jgi:hypothetical protein